MSRSNTMWLPLAAMFLSAVLMGWGLTQARQSTAKLAGLRPDVSRAAQRTNQSLQAVKSAAAPTRIAGALETLQATMSVPDHGTKEEQDEVAALEAKIRRIQLLDPASLPYQRELMEVFARIDRLTVNTSRDVRESPWLYNVATGILEAVCGVIGFLISAAVALYKKLQQRTRLRLAA